MMPCIHKVGSVYVVRGWARLGGVAPVWALSFVVVSAACNGSSSSQTSESSGATTGDDTNGINDTSGTTGVSDTSDTTGSEDPWACADDEVVSGRFTDAALRLAICNALGEEHLCTFTCAQAQSLTVLGASSRDITKLTGLSYLANLQTLYLYGNSIDTIQGLDNLSNLRKLFLSSNDIDTIQGLDKLTSLQELDFSYNDLEAPEIYKLSLPETAPGLGMGDEINLESNPIDCAANDFTMALENFENRGITVYDNC